MIHSGSVEKIPASWAGRPISAIYADECVHRFTAEQKAALSACRDAGGDVTAHPVMVAEMARVEAVKVALAQYEKSTWAPQRRKVMAVVRRHARAYNRSYS